MATRISLTYFGMSGEGATVREAKADAGRKLEALVKHAEHTPSIVAVGDCASLVWHFGSYGWCNALVSVHGKPQPHLSPAIPGEATEEEAMVRAAMHTADLAWSHEVEDDDAFAAACTCALHRQARSAGQDPRSGRPLRLATPLQEPQGSRLLQQ